MMKTIEIKSRFSGGVIFSVKAISLRAAVEIAVRRRVNLRGAYLQGADLRGAYLQGADLQGAYLRGAYLQGAYLQGADLRGAYLQGAYLQGADLQGADLWCANLRGADLWCANLDVKTPPINSHQFASEILWRNAEKESQKNFSARIRMETNLCWNDFYKLARKMKVFVWAKKTLSKWDEYKSKIERIKSGDKP